MRLIDADKAKEKLRGNAQKDGNPFVGAIVEMFCEFLDQAPTVEDAEERGEIGSVPRWIPISDPPKETGHYLVSLHQENPDADLNDIVLDAWFQKEAFLFTSSEAGWHLLNEFYDLTPQLREYITHWMPLPEPPEVE